MSSHWYRQGLERMATSSSLFTPSGYEQVRRRDWRFLWLRWRTVDVPVWADVKVTVISESYAPVINAADMTWKAAGGPGTTWTGVMFSEPCPRCGINGRVGNPPFCPHTDCPWIKREGTP